jgi:phosphoribosylformylglycinamidine (FGAM) synthase-like amidotransferase family enzyme
VLLGHSLDVSGILTLQTSIVLLCPHPTHVFRDRLAGDEDF